MNIIRPLYRIEQSDEAPWSWEKYSRGSYILLITLVVLSLFHRELVKDIVTHSTKRVLVVFVTFEELVQLFYKTH